MGLESLPANRVSEEGVRVGRSGAKVRCNFSIFDRGRGWGLLQADFFFFFEGEGGGRETKSGGRGYVRFFFFSMPTDGSSSVGILCNIRPTTRNELLCVCERGRSLRFLSSPTPHSHFV